MGCLCRILASIKGAARRSARPDEREARARLRIRVIGSRHVSKMTAL
jgi:hypothetical protein